MQAEQYVTRNADVTIICQPEAAPLAKIKWEFNGAELSTSQDAGARVRQLANGNLHITGVQDSDQGYYTCLAENPYGSAQSTGNLTVVCEYCQIYNEKKLL